MDQYVPEVRRDNVFIEVGSQAEGILTAKDTHFQQALADSDGLFDALFGACLMAARTVK